MSYSVCFACGEMVSMYQKWCPECLGDFQLRQGDWREFKPKTRFGTEGRKAEVLFEIARDTDLAADVAIKIAKQKFDWDDGSIFAREVCER